MTEVVFQSTMDGSDAREELVSLKERTLVARFSDNTGMYRLTNDLVGEALLRVLPACEVVAMGCLRGNHEWHITLASREAVDVLITAGSITVRTEQGTRTAYFTPLMPREVSVRVLWTPAWVPAEAVHEMLASFSEVTHFERCRWRLGEQAVHNLQYTARLCNVFPARIPDRVTLQVLGENVPLLLIVRGKPRSCFLCGSLNHTQVNCPNPTCRYCKEQGHVVTNCPKKRHQYQRTQTPPPPGPVSLRPHGNLIEVLTTDQPQEGETPATTTESPEGAAATPSQTPLVEDQTPETAGSMETAPPPVEATKRKHSGSTTEEPPVSSVRREVPSSPEVTVIPETQETAATDDSIDTPGDIDHFPPLEIDESSPDV